MTSLKARVSGAWVTTAAAGAARLGGVSIPFPSGGEEPPAYETFAWPEQPTLTNGVDGGETYTMGIRFSMITGKPCYGIQWRVPDAVATPPGGAHMVSLWSVTGESLMRSKEFVPTPGVYQDILFDTPVDLLPLTNYVAAVYTRHYVFRSTAGSYPATPSGNVVGDEGRLTPNVNQVAYPAPQFSAWYYISPLMGV
jgi:hypothetical protein